MSREIIVTKDTILISKRNPNVFDRFESFLPSNFSDILKKLRISRCCNCCYF